MSQLARRENAPHKAAFVTSLSRYSWARDSPQNKAPPQQWLKLLGAILWENFCFTSGESPKRPRAMGR